MSATQNPKTGPKASLGEAMFVGYIKTLGNWEVSRLVLELKVDDLSDSSEEAFALYEQRARTAFQDQIQNDRQYHSDHDGNYEGSYAPERSYVTAILAFLDEYSIESNIEDISELENDEFYKEFGRFKSKVEYISTRFSLRKNRLEKGSLGTAITIEKNYKSEVGSHLEKIRKIINQEVSEGAKKDKIFKKIGALQSEVDRDITTIDAAFGRMLALSRVMGECGDNVKPAIDQLERIKKIFWDNSDKVDALPKPERPKALPKASTETGSRDLDDEIPF